MSLVITIGAAIAAITMFRPRTDVPTSNRSSAVTLRIGVDGMVKLLDRKLGASLPTASNFQSEKWMEALYTVASQGISLEAFQAWGRRLSKGDCIPDFASDSRKVELAASQGILLEAFQAWGRRLNKGDCIPDFAFDSRKAELKALIPNLFLPNMTYKCPKSQKFFEGLDTSSFDKLVREYRRHLDRSDHERQERMLSRIKEWLPSVPPQRVACRFLTDVVAEGTQWAPFIVTQRDWPDPWGIHYKKHVARWIMSIRRAVDSNFDPEGTGPPPRPADLSSKRYSEEIECSNQEAMKKMKLDHEGDI